MRTFILGTDWWTDCDDAVAVRILARAHKQRKIKLAGIGINACMEYSVPSLDGFLQTENVNDIPLGLDFEAVDFKGHPPYQKRLSALCGKYTSNASAVDAVRLYRQILQSAESKVEILEIGFLQVIANVLKSQPDDISPLDGMQLVKEKVEKIWVMAGKWDEENGKENNFAQTPRASVAASYFCANCPVPVTFLGFEVGVDVISGGLLPENDTLHTVLCDHGSPNGRCSWDPMLALLALTGNEEQAGYSTVAGTAQVNPETGENNFVTDKNGSHLFVVKTQPNDFYANIINNLIR